MSQERQIPPEAKIEEAVVTPLRRAQSPALPSPLPARRQVAPVKPSAAYERTKARVDALQPHGAARREVLAVAKRIDATNAVRTQAAENLAALTESIGTSLIDQIEHMRAVERSLADDPDIDPSAWLIAKSNAVVTAGNILAQANEATERLLAELAALPDDPDLWVDPTVGEALGEIVDAVASGLTLGASDLDGTAYELSFLEMGANLLTLGQLAAKRKRSLRRDQEAERLARRRRAGLEPEEVIDVDLA